MLDTLDHLIDGESIGGEVTGESLSRSNLDNVAARFRNSGAAGPGSSPIRINMPVTSAAISVQAW